MTISHDPPASPFLLGFADTRTDGHFPVTGVDGSVLAWIDKPVFTNRFIAYAADGQQLCAGQLRMFGSWVATGPDGADLATLTRQWFQRSTLTLRGGALTATVQGRYWGRDWTVIDSQGRTLMSAVPHNTGLFAPDAWLVNSWLTLPETLAATELHRLELKRRRRASNAS